MIGVDFFDHQHVSEPETVVACYSFLLFEDGPWVGGSAFHGSSSLWRASSVVGPWSLSVPNAVHGVHIVIIVAFVGLIVVGQLPLPSVC